MKDHLYWNDLHNRLRSSQGMPQAVPVYPDQGTTPEDILDLTAETIFHVASQSGFAEAVHLFVTSPVDCVVYVRVLSSSLLMANGTKTRLKGWPSTLDAMTFRVRATQPSPIPVLQGYVVSNGAGVSLMASAPGAKAFGFTVK